MSQIFDETTLPIAIKSLLENNNFDTEGPVSIHGASVDIIATAKGNPFSPKIYIEATISYVDNTKYGKDLSKFALIKQIEPSAICIIVSSAGFTEKVKERALATNIKTLTYDELFKQFETFDPYIEYVTSSDNKLSKSLIDLNEIYEEPLFDDECGTDTATSYLTEWRDTNSNKDGWIVVVGEYGTGKTALTQILQFRWISDYKKNSSIPIPFRIELREFTRQFDARGLLHHILDQNQLPHIPIDFVYSLIKSGKIVLLLDGYDEMAQYMNSRERRACLEALADLSQEGAKGILTSRPNYFSENEELQVFETLYSSIEYGQYHLTSQAKCLLEKEKRIDALLEKHIIERRERTLRDLTHAQTIELVKRKLKHDKHGQKVIIKILSNIFRNTGESDNVSLSGKPVIISYLLEVVDQLKDNEESAANAPLNEWTVYKLIVDQLMLRDLARTPDTDPNKRRYFLQNLAVWLSKKSNPCIQESEFRKLISKIFKEELMRVMQGDRKQLEDNLFANLRSSCTLTSSVENRNGWRFSHNSLREFLVTEVMLKLLDEKTVLSEQVPISEPMRLFFSSLEKSEKLHTFNRLMELWGARTSHPSISQVLSLVWDNMLTVYKDEGKTINDLIKDLCGERPVFNGLELRNISFSKSTGAANLETANFSESSLIDCDLSECNVSSADFSNSYIEGAKFKDGILKNAYFTQCIITDIDLSNADVQGANFEGIDDSLTVYAINTNGDKTRFAGKDAIGYLNYNGAKTDKVDDIYKYKHHPHFSIVEKICSVMSEQTARQLHGLTKRGAAQKNPQFADSFVDILIKNGWVELKKNRPGQIFTTAKGRDFFRSFKEETRMNQVVIDFLETH